MYSDGPVELDGVWCNHKIFDGEEVIESEDHEKGRFVTSW
jgi:hypothetical protein